VSVARAGGGSLDEVGERGVESVGDAEQVAVARVIEGVFDALDGGAIEAGAFGELLLCEVPVQTPVADACTEGSAGIGDPLGIIGGEHWIHALRHMIISQQLP
jgi:hypothetical protein